MWQTVYIGIKDTVKAARVLRAPAPGGELVVPILATAAYAGLAQLVELRVYTAEVGGPSPSARTI